MGKKKVDPKILALKLEVAAELGLLEKIKKEGWGSLSAAESGRIGGMLARMKMGPAEDDKDAGSP